MPELTDQEAQIETTDEELDTDAALAEISSDLFGQEKEGEKVDGDDASVPEGEKPTDASSVVETPPQDEVKPDQNQEQVQEIGAPKTWTKEALGEWAKIPPRAQQEILKREEDMHTGLAQYREKAELGTQYDKVVEPYRAGLAAENINPVELFNAFAGNHYLLSRGTPEQKLEIAANLVGHYGIDITQLVAHLGSQPQVDPAIKELKEHISQLEGKLTTREQSEADAARTEFTRQVEEFSSDPENVYFNDVASDMTTLLKSRAAGSLQEAYEKAIWLNPVTRAKEQARLTAEATDLAKTQAAERAKQAKDATSADVKTSAKDRNGTVPVGSLDDTLKETLDKIQSRG